MVASVSATVSPVALPSSAVASPSATSIRCRRAVRARRPGKLSLADGGRQEIDLRFDRRGFRSRPAEASAAAKPPALSTTVVMPPA